MVFLILFGAVAAFAIWFPAPFEGKIIIFFIGCFVIALAAERAGE